MLSRRLFHDEVLDAAKKLAVACIYVPKKKGGSPLLGVYLSGRIFAHSNRSRPGHSRRRGGGRNWVCSNSNPLSICFSIGNKMMAFIDPSQLSFQGGEAEGKVRGALI